MTVRAVAHLVDGSAMDLPWTPREAARLKALQAAGKSGKQLIHELYTDDWGPPPNFIAIKGVDEHGRSVDIQLPYD